MALGGFVYVLALICFGVAGTLLAMRGELASRGELFWGGGHVLQFVYAALMLTNWSILARMSLGEEAVDDRVFLASLALIALIALAGPAFYAALAPFSDHQREAFRFLQFGIAAPTLIFAVSLLARALRSTRPWPWRDPAFFALAASLALFALGGAMGFLIDGSDTRTPAHYHAVITAVSVSSAGMLLNLRPQGIGQGACAAGRDAASPRPLRRRSVRRLDCDVRRRRLRGVAEDPGRGGIARHNGRRRHGGARDRVHLHHSGRRRIRHRRHPRSVAGGASALDGGALTSDRARLLQLGRTQMHDREAEEGKRKRLVGERELDRNSGEQRRNAEPDLHERDGGKNDGAA